MSMALILSILGGFQGIISAAPQVVALVKQAKEFFEGLFKAGLITKEQQLACALQLDAHAAMVQAGIVPPPWQVEPDPVSPTNPTP